MAAQCNACGAVNDSSAAFCNQCGSALSSEVTPGALDFSHLPIQPPVPAAAYHGPLAQRFKDMGVLAGRSRSEIEEVVGQPQSVSAVAADGVLLQWMENRSRWWGGAEAYHIALIFDSKGICGGVTHEAHQEV